MCTEDSILSLHLIAYCNKQSNKIHKMNKKYFIYKTYFDDDELINVNEMLNPSCKKCLNEN